MIKIAVLTATRAEYGLMRQLLFRIRDDSDFDLRLLVTGTHLSEKYGMTIDEIRNDSIPIAASIDILCERDGSIDASRTMANAIEKFSDYFSNDKPDLLFVDGDRYETLAVCIAAINNNVPIAHCGGGATTEGANDEYWRHAITKLSVLHFPTMNKYRKRIIRMGEEPDRVCVSGSPGLENIRVMKLGKKDDVEKKIGMTLDRPYALVTFHPVTLEDDTIAAQFSELLIACENTRDMIFIFTMANADRGGEVINAMIEEYCDKHHESSARVSSLGTYYYLSAMRYCEFVLGNSSSGLIEAPSFKIPTINIGDRQKGRERAGSIIDCKPIAGDICNAIKIARSASFKEVCATVNNPNGDGHTSDRIIKKIKEMYYSGKLTMEKTFFDDVEND